MTESLRPAAPPFRKQLRSWLGRRALRACLLADPETLQRRSEQALLARFRQLALEVPWYARLLAKREVSPGQVRCVEDFRRLAPILSKEDVFQPATAETLFPAAWLQDLQGIMPSSGSSRQGWSFGLLHRRGSEAATRQVDALLDELFQAGRRKTLLLNCLAMGVRIPSTLPCADLSVRSDVALAVLRRFRDTFEQFLVVCDTYFAKRLLEEGLEAGIDWAEWPLRLIVGGDGFPESYRGYLQGLLGSGGSNTRDQRILSSLGLAELEQNLFHESGHSIAIRQAAERDERLREALFGNCTVAPLLFHYYPQRTYLEREPGTEGRGASANLLVSMLGRHCRTPLLRYRSGDCGILLTHQELALRLRRLGYEDLLPPWRLPLVAVTGRAKQTVRSDSHSLDIEWVRSRLYQDAELAGLSTGQFWVEARQGRICVSLQLKDSALPGARLQERFASNLDPLGRVTVKLVPYFAYQRGMGVDYERKLRHLETQPASAGGPPQAAGAFPCAAILAGANSDAG